MPGRMYAVPLDNASVTTSANQDIFQLVAAAAIPFYLHHIRLEAATTSDERVRLRLVRRSTTGSGGSAITLAAKDQGNTVAAATTGTSLVTTPGTQSALILPFYWSQLSPFEYLPTPEERELCSGGGRLCLHLSTAVASARNWSGFAVIEEIG